MNVYRLISEAPIRTIVSGTGSVGAGAYSWLADATLLLQFISAGMSVGLGAYAIYRIIKKYEK